MFRLRILLPALASIVGGTAFAQNIGTQFCAATPNSAGQAAVISGSYGTGVGSDLHLEVTGGVPNEFGYFLVGPEITPGLSVSNGVLCLLGTPTSNMYRYNVAGGSMNSLGIFDSAGVMQNVFGTSQSGSGFDVPTSIPDSVPITLSIGDTWNFQYWHRDTPAGMGTSNFSLGLSVTYGLPHRIIGMRRIPAGTFQMGSNVTLPSQPIHSVTFAEHFWISRWEVTNTEYNEMMGLAPPATNLMNRPVDVNWHGARAYCTALTTREQAAGNLPPGLEYRLPTEAEWEYACRAGTTTPFHTGTELLCSQAEVFWADDIFNTWCASTGTVDVRSYPPNAWALYDMHGNAGEWCLDSYDVYSAGSVTDPFVTGGLQRIIRGGSAFNDASACQSATRSGWDPNQQFTAVGFRVVLGRVLIP